MRNFQTIPQSSHNLQYIFSKKYPQKFDIFNIVASCYHVDFYKIKVYLKFNYQKTQKIMLLIKFKVELNLNFIVTYCC